MCFTCLQQLVCSVLQQQSWDKRHLSSVAFHGLRGLRQESTPGGDAAHQLVVQTWLSLYDKCESQLAQLTVDPAALATGRQYTRKFSAERKQLRCPEAPEPTLDCQNPADYKARGICRLHTRAAVAVSACAARSSSRKYCCLAACLNAIACALRHQGSLDARQVLTVPQSMSVARALPECRL